MKDWIWNNEVLRQPTEKELSIIRDPIFRKYIQELSSDEFEGRGIGTEVVFTINSILYWRVNSKLVEAYCANTRLMTVILS